MSGQKTPYGTASFDAMVTDAGIEVVKIPPRCPRAKSSWTMTAIGRHGAGGRMLCGRRPSRAAPRTLAGTGRRSSPTMPVLPADGGALDSVRAPTDVRVVPDLDEKLLLALDRVEALLGSLAVWETEDGVELPAPFADRKTLSALQAVRELVRPTQRRGGPQLVPGRLPRRGWTGRPLPLHFVPVADAPIATLQHAVQVLSVQRAYPGLHAAVERYAEVLGQPPLALVNCLSRIVGLLTLPWDDDLADTAAMLPTRRGHAGVGSTTSGPTAHAPPGPPATGPRHRCR
jgi:hypothetical protein